MLKKIGVIALTCSILFSVNVFADQKQVLEEEWNYTFEEEKEWLEELDVEDDDIKVLENLFNEALKKDTDEAWKNYDEYLNKLLPEDMEDDFDIEEEKEWLEELQVSQADMSALETLFNEAIALEEADKFDEADVKWTAYEEILEKYYDAFEFTFDDEVEWLKEIGVTDADIVALKTFYNDAIALEEADKMDEAEKKWIAFDEILDKYEDAFDEEEDYSVEEEKAWLKEIGVSDADIDTLVLLFNEALVLEEAEKFEEAENKWVTYDEILDKYFDLEDME